MKACVKAWWYFVSSSWVEKSSKHKLQSKSELGVKSAPTPLPRNRVFRQKLSKKHDKTGEGINNFLHVDVMWCDVKILRHIYVITSRT